MDRRDFLKASALVSVASLPTVNAADEPKTTTTLPKAGGLDAHCPREFPGERGVKTMLFWDYWKLHELNNAELVQGQPKWRPEANYTDPFTKSPGTGRVFFDQGRGKWRKIWASDEAYVAESEDGIKWVPADLRDVRPNHGPKLAPHHVHTFPGKGHNYGWVYLDPLARDGFPYKIPVIQNGQRVYDRAKADPKHRWHDLTKRFSEPTNHMYDHFMHVSNDGYRWEERVDYEWNQGIFFPEEPHLMFYNHLTGTHSLICRPGLGDRRVALTETETFVSWTEPRVILAPELSDEKLLEFYTMPTFPYGQYFVGLVWASHFSSADGPDHFVLHKGPQNAQLALSTDGRYFTRPTKTDFIEFNEPGEIGCHSIRPEGMVVLEDEIRIYSNAGLSAHGTPVPKELKENSKAMVMHSLRRDGFMYFQSRGHQAQITTRPFAVFDGEFTMNAEAPTGTVEFELRDLKNQPIEGYTFADCEPMKFKDSLKFPLRWKNRRDVSELIGKVIRMSVRFYNARIYSFRADYHILDAHDFRRLRDDLPLISTELFGA